MMINLPPSTFIDVSFHAKGIKPQRNRGLKVGDTPAVMAIVQGAASTRMRSP
jgi:hypothetical protein